jgi:RNA polymerase sigma-70 factor (ECF subfamily)
MTQDEQELIEQARRGDDQAVDQLLLRYYPALRAFVRLRVGAELRLKESTSDLVQSVCREVLGAIDRFEYQGDRSFRAWLFQAALNKIRQKGRFHRAERRDPRREHLFASGSQAQELQGAYGTFLTPSMVAMGDEAVARIELAFDRLSDDAREVITMSRFVGLSHAEIAARMGRNEGAVRTLLSRSLARLASLLDEAEGR